MAAAITDLITQATVNSRPTPTTVSSTRSAAGATLSCLALTGWPTGTAVHFITYKINTSGAKIAGSQIDWKGIVSGTTLTNVTLKAGTDVGNAVGDIVEASPTAAYANDLVTWGTTEHTQTGTHSAVTATSVTTTGAVTAGNGLTLTTGTLSLPSASINQAALPLGAVVQVVSTNFATIATGTTLIPFDNTIPQNTEGDQYMTLSITPKSATNTLVVQVVGWFGNSVVNNLAMALFQDSTANALAVSLFTVPSATFVGTTPLIHTMTSGTTSSTTFKVRAGGSLAGTTTFNGANAAAIYGAITKSSITIWEYKA